MIDVRNYSAAYHLRSYL